MKRGICGTCGVPVAWMPIFTGKRANADGMWVHDHAQTHQGSDIRHDPMDVHSITST